MISTKYLYYDSENFAILSPKSHKHGVSPLHPGGVYGYPRYFAYREEIKPLPVKHSLSLLALSLSLASAPLLAANHYIRAGATGSQTGSDWTNACPWFVGTCAPQYLVRGDTYYVASGTYSNANVVFNTPESGSSVITIRKATLSDHGTSVGWADTYALGPANIVQNSSQTPLINFATGYWTLDGVTGGGPGSWKAGFGFYMDIRRKTNPTSGPGSNNGVSNITLSHIEVEGDGGDGDGSGSNTNDGITFGRGNNINVSYMYIHDTGGVSIFWRASNSVISYSWMARNESTSGQHSEGAQVYSAIGTKVSNLTFAYDIWEDIEGTGIIVCACDALQVYGNIFFHTDSYIASGRRGLGNGSVTTTTAPTCQSACNGTTDEGVTNSVITNNSFSTLVGAGGVLFPNSQSAGNSAYNNLFYNITSLGWTNVTTHDYNWFYPPDPQQTEPNKQNGAGNPFVSRTTADFHLTAHTTSGIALTSASSLTLAAPFASIDIDGVSRGLDGSWDRGTYQYLPSVQSIVVPPSNLQSTIN